MQTYLKTQPVWKQLLLFLGMALGLLLVVFIFGGLVLSKMTGISLMEMGDSKNWMTGDPKTLFMLRGLLLLQFLGLFLVPSLLFAYFSDPQPLQYLGFKKPSKHIYWILGILALIVAIPLVEYTGILNRELPVSARSQKWIQGKEEEAARTIRYLLAGTSISNLLVNYVFIALFAAVGEELFFRGILQRLFIRALKNPWAGILIAAFLFSFFHFQFLGFIPRFLLGVLLGAIYWYSGSIWPAIIAHFVYDALFLTIAHFNHKLIENPEATLIENSSGLIIMAVASLALTALVVWLMKKNSTTSYQRIYQGDFPGPSEKDLSF
jgi:uncharacterized protein